MEHSLSPSATVTASSIWKIAIVVLPILAIAIQWLTHETIEAELIREVSQLTQVDFLETNWLYLYLHLFSFIPVFALSFDRRVHFYTSWKYLFPAIFIVAAIFIAWDVVFTDFNVWNFNETYFLGIKLFGLPIEEWLFFITIPFASVFIYECLNYYVPKNWLLPYEQYISWALIAILLIGGIVFWERIYTSTTFLLTSAFVLYHYLFLPKTDRARFYFAFLVILLPFALVDGVLTGSYTSEPIVIYHPEEFLNIRLPSVPIEDYVYGFLMLFSIVSLMEKWRK